MNCNNDTVKSRTEDFTHIARSNKVEDIFKNGTHSFTGTKPLRRNPNLDKVVLKPLDFKQLIWDEVDDATDESVNNEDDKKNKYEKLKTIDELLEIPNNKPNKISVNNEVVSVSKKDKLHMTRCREDFKILHRSPRIINDGKGVNYFEQIPVASIVSKVRKDSLDKDRLHAIRSNQELRKLNFLNSGKEEIKENIPVVTKPKKDDSFDFDFSALSHYTPIKQKAKETVNNFITPKVSNLKATPQPVIQYSAKKAVEQIGRQKKDVNLSREQLSVCELTPEAGYKRIMVNGIKYVMMNCLGKGGSSEVFDCFNEEKKMHVAIKCVTLANAQSATGYINEVKLLKALQKCDRIIKLFDYEILESEKKLYVVLEKGGEDLAKILKQLALKQSHIPVYMLIFYWLEMLHAVQQIHKNGIIHSDLKPANFLRAEGGLKLIDFGIATSVATDMTSVYKNTQEGSCNYISPEALNNEPSSNNNSPTESDAKYKLNFKSDVWSLGCILYQLIYRRTPFEHIKQTFPKLYAIMNPEYQIQYPPAPWVPQRFITTIKKCLQHNVKSRPSVEDLIKEYEEILQKL